MKFLRIRSLRSHYWYRRRPLPALFPRTSAAAATARGPAAAVAAAAVAAAAAPAPAAALAPWRRFVRHLRHRQAGRGSSATTSTPTTSTGARRPIRTPASAWTAAWSPTLEWTGTDGDPNPGSLKVTVTFTGFKQYIDPQINLATPRTSERHAQHRARAHPAGVGHVPGRRHPVPHVAAATQSPNAYVYVSAPFINSSSLTLGQWIADSRSTPARSRRRTAACSIRRRSSRSASSSRPAIPTRAERHVRPGRVRDRHRSGLIAKAGSLANPPPTRLLRGRGRGRRRRWWRRRGGLQRALDRGGGLRVAVLRVLPAEHVVVLARRPRARRS